jgi:hypothetical protein
MEKIIENPKPKGDEQKSCNGDEPNRTPRPADAGDPCGIEK